MTFEYQAAISQGCDEQRSAPEQRQRGAATALDERDERGERDEGVLRYVPVSAVAARLRTRAAPASARGQRSRSRASVCGEHLGLRAAVGHPARPRVVRQSGLAAQPWPDRFDMWPADMAGYWPCPICATPLAPVDRTPMKLFRCVDVRHGDVRAREGAGRGLSASRPARDRTAVASERHEVDLPGHGTVGALTSRWPLSYPTWMDGSVDGSTFLGGEEGRYGVGVRKARTAGSAPCAIVNVHVARAGG